MAGDDFTASMEAPKDRWGRYLIDKSGKKTGYTRVTTIAKTLSDTASLADWKTRMAITGLIQRPDLLAQASTAIDDRDKMNKLASEAIDAAGAYSRANLGTALHAITAELDAGRQPIILPGLQADVNAYEEATRRHGFQMPTDWIEVLVIHDHLQYAGTADRFTVLPDGRIVVLDLKTGSSLQYAQQEIAIQLAAYANAENIYDWRTGTRTDMPKIDRTTGLICHLPAGEAKCTIHTVDLTRGWTALQMALEVREWRKAKNLFTEVQPAGTGANGTFVRERIEALAAEKQKTLRAIWPADLPKIADCNIDQLIQISRLIDRVE